MLFKEKIHIVFFVIFLSFLGIFSSTAQEVIELEKKCNIKLPYLNQENDEETLKLNYTMRFLSYKIGELPDFVVRQGKEAHAEFKFDKSCQEILQMIIEKL